VQGTCLATQITGIPGATSIVPASTSNINLANDTSSIKVSCNSLLPSYLQSAFTCAAQQPVFLDKALIQPTQRWVGLVTPLMQVVPCDDGYAGTVTATCQHNGVVIFYQYGYVFSGTCTPVSPE
jgi:hypothetical protein